METFVIVFIIVGVCFSFATIGYVIYDYLKERKNKLNLEKGGHNDE